jgi:hypothetical protein
MAEHATGGVQEICVFVFDQPGSTVYMEGTPYFCAHSRLYMQVAAKQYYSDLKDG